MTDGTSSRSAPRRATDERRTRSSRLGAAPPREHAHQLLDVDALLGGAQVMVDERDKRRAEGRKRDLPGELRDLPQEEWKTRRSNRATTKPATKETIVTSARSSHPPEKDIASVAEAAVIVLGFLARLQLCRGVNSTCTLPPRRC